MRPEAFYYSWYNTLHCTLLQVTQPSLGQTAAVVYTTKYIDCSIRIRLCDIALESLWYHGECEAPCCSKVHLFLPVISHCVSLTL